ncbi:hypothetical protein GQ53DRAFT_637417, partial [Thozetella sp. PMI_491]
MIGTLDNLRQVVGTFSKSLEKLLSRPPANDDIASDGKPQWGGPINLPDHLIPATGKPEELVATKKAEVEIINSLLFDTIHDRERSIPEAYKKTFEWMFDGVSQPNDNAVASSFTEWLRRDSQDMYWIAGKPGSGKSTLMKYILKHHHLEEFLDQWQIGPGNLPLLIAGYYSWNAGMKMQNSCDGLLRTLLHECLTRFPDLAPVICPKRWTILKVFDKQAILPEWTWDELASSFQLLAGQAGKLFRLALFIDGLDEFEGDHSSLVDFIWKISRHDGIKVCVSSRPWNVFNDAYAQSPSLAVETLTRDDIALLVHEKLGESPGFEEMKAISPEEATQVLDGIVEKAEGVFLWVSLVVRSLLENLREGDTLQNLKATLDALPTDLSKLFDSIWNRISPRYLAEASKIMQIRSVRKHPLTPLTLWCTDESVPLDFNVRKITRTMSLGIRKNIKRRVNSRTRGLLELKSAGHIDYLHRTVREWTTDKEVWSRIVSQSPADFDPNLSLMRSKMI